MSDTVTAAPAATTSESEAQGHEGNFIWYELMTSDQDAAIDFYTSVVGWTAADFPTPGGEAFRYTILSAGERGIAGLMQINDEMRENGARPAWVGVINVGDCDSGAEAVETAGGKVLRAPEDIPTIGRFAVVADPGGAVYQLLAPFPREDEPKPLAPETPGKVSWHELVTAAGQEKAFAFYSGLYGWTTETEMDMGAMGKYRIFAKDGVQLGGMMDKPENVPVSAWTFYINVDGIDSAVERVKAKGGQVIMGPMEVPGGSWVIQGIDPQGAHFALVSLKR
jgi:uncharacterized protein